MVLGTSLTLMVTVAVPLGLTQTGEAVLVTR
jgi:hypothetical protein